MATATPLPISIGGAIEAMNSLGITAVILVAAVISVASVLYRRFRR
jgi:hypothetical protein